MRKHRYPLLVASLLALAACVPGVAEYTQAEAPNQLRVDGAESEITLAFYGGSDRLASGETARLERLVLNGAIRPADRVQIAAAGGATLAQRRTAAIAAELLHYGIVADQVGAGSVPANRAIVMIGRYAVTLPPCPNWSSSPSTDFTNMPSSNFGCATATNLGLMVANPADLVSPGALGPADGMTSASAVDRFLNDRVKVPPIAQIAPIGAASGGDTGGGGGGGGATGAAGTP
jgi:pilus assembly protein CpaD